VYTVDRHEWESLFSANESETRINIREQRKEGTVEDTKGQVDVQKGGIYPSAILPILSFII